jgi:hypothetical protein
MSVMTAPRSDFDDEVRIEVRVVPGLAFAPRTVTLGVADDARPADGDVLGFVRVCAGMGLIVLTDWKVLKMFHLASFRIPARRIEGETEVPSGDVRKVRCQSTSARPEIAGQPNP